MGALDRNDLDLLKIGLQIIMTVVCQAFHGVVGISQKFSLSPPDPARRQGRGLALFYRQNKSSEGLGDLSK